MNEIKLQHFNVKTNQKDSTSVVTSTVISACEYFNNTPNISSAKLTINGKSFTNISSDQSKWNNKYVIFASKLNLSNEDGAELHSVVFSDTSIIPFATKGMDFDSKNAPILYYSGDFQPNSAPPDLSLMLPMTYQIHVPAKYHNRLIQSEDYFWIYCVILTGTSIIVYRCSKDQIGKLIKSNSCSLTSKTFSKYPFNRSSNQGFYLDAGWKEESKTFSPPYTSTGNYVGYDPAKNEHSQIVNDLSRIKSYPKKFELVQVDDNYYKEVEYTEPGYDIGQIGDFIGGAISSVGDMVNLSTSPKPLDLNIGLGAINVSNDYIDNFKNWKVNFIPNQREKTDSDPQTDQQTVDATLYYPIVNNHILTIKSSSFGKKNTDVYATENPSKLLLKKQEEDCQEKLLTDIDALMEKIANKDSYTEDVRLLPQYELVLKLKKEKQATPSLPQTLKLREYFFSTQEDEIRGAYDFDYYFITYKDGIIQREKIACTFQLFFEGISQALKNNFNVTYVFQTGIEQERGVLNLYSLKLFEAFTRGHDFIQENYTTVRPEEMGVDEYGQLNKLMSYRDNYFTYKYSGRNIDIFQGNENISILPNGTKEGLSPIYIASAHSCDILQEYDVTLGDTYGEQEYFIEAIRVQDKVYDYDKKDYVYPPEYEKTYTYKDSFKVKDYLDKEQGGFDSTVYTDDDISVVYGKIDLLRCEMYTPLAATYENNWCDCSYKINEQGIPIRECFYQKEGYCPYRFQTEKHPRRIRTLEQSKSNRFNLIQELSKVFQVYPYFYIEHKKNGEVVLDENGKMKKNVFYMTEKGKTNLSGFRYEKNLSGITRTVDSNAITTKLYVQPNDSRYSSTGQCSIDMSKDNLSRTNYIVDFSYYIQIGALDAEQVERDLYGKEKDDLAFLTKMGYYNQLYDKYSNLIITLTGETLTNLQAEILVSTTGIKTALEERKKIAQRMYQFKKSQEKLSQSKMTNSYIFSDSYRNYVEKYREQSTILWSMVEDLFFTANYFSMPIKNGEDEVGEPIYDWIVINTDNLGDSAQEKAYRELQNQNKYCKGEIFWYLVMENEDDEVEWQAAFNKWNDFEEKIITPKKYPINGKLGRYKSLYNEITYWKTEREKILNKINELYSIFSQKYEPYIKEGTYSESNYLTNDEYYWSGMSVLNDSCKPKVTYDINVIDISPLKGNKDIYDFDLADTTFIEDIDFFGINTHTGLSNRQKVLLSGTTDDLDDPSKNKFNVKNYTTAFEDLFSQISASVQSLTFNENIYKRASNFSAQKYISTDVLQSTLDLGDLTLINAPNNNILLNEKGIEGDDINNIASQYKLSGEGLFFSTDGGETWDLGVGPKGLNLDYARFGQLDASKVQIVDGKYIYFLWDKDGINAYRNPSTSSNGLVDFARFNKYGLSLIENETIRLRAGYAYEPVKNSQAQGNYKDEAELINQKIGFYLYNDKGQPIFKTETNSLYQEDTEANYSTRLSLTGEIFATNKILDSGKNISSQEQFLVSNDYNYQYIFKENEITSPKMPEGNIHYTFISALLNEKTPEEQAYVLDAAHADFEQKEDGSIAQIKKNITISFTPNEEPIEYRTYSFLYQIPSFSIYLRSAYTYDPEDSVSSNLMLSRYDFRGLSIISDNELSIERQLTDEIIDSLVLNIINGTLEAEVVKTLLSLDEDFDTTNIFIDETNVLIEGSNNYIVTTAYGGQKLGYWWSKTTERVLIKQDENASITVSSSANVKKQSIAYKTDIETGVTEVKSFYIIQDELGNETFWLNKGESKTTTSQNQTMSGEVGIYINNKRALELQDSQNSLDDTTDFRQWIIDKNTSTDDFSKAVTTLYSGAERVFSIATGRENGTSIEIDNVLSILKNGVLYMGGTITDKYGKKLDINGLSYLPDEIKVYNPSIVMSNSGQIWCDWDQFFYSRRDPQTGILSPTNVSLLQVFEEIQSWSGNLSSTTTQSGNVSISGYFIDEADVDANA